MKTVLLSFAFVLLALPGWAGDKEDFTKIEQEWAAALLKGDAQGFRKFLAEGWKITLSDGMIQTADEMGQELTSGDLQFTTCKVEDIDVQIFGDTAIVRGIDEVAGKLNGGTFEAKERFTDVFIRRDGRWLCAATHDSPMEQP